MRYSTGNEIVDKMVGIELTGNIVPAAWFQTIVNEDTGKPYGLAIFILSDIVYWYRPKEVRNECTGEFIGYEKKFKEDLLQRSYKQLEDQFGFSSRQIKQAVVFLEEIGVLKRHFRHVHVRGQQLNNVMYLELIPEKLFELTFGEGACDEICTHLCTKNVIGVSENVQRSIPKNDIGVDKFVQTNTENTTKNTTEISNIDYPIISYPEAEEIFKEQIDYDVIVSDSPTLKELLDGIVNIAADILSSDSKTIRVNKENLPTERVKAKLKSLNMEHIKYIFNGLDDSRTAVKNTRAALITMMYNAPDTMNLYYGAKVNSLNRSD